MVTPVSLRHERAIVRQAVQRAICVQPGNISSALAGDENMTDFLRRMWGQDEGQDIAEYAVMLAVILVIVVGTIRLIGSNSNNVFSSVASSIGS